MMKIIGDGTKSTFLRVFIDGKAMDIYIEYHEFKNDIPMIKSTGADSVHLYTRHSGGEFTHSLMPSIGPRNRVTIINAALNIKEI